MVKKDGRGKRGRVRSRRAPPARSMFTMRCEVPRVVSMSSPKLTSAMTRWTAPRRPSEMYFLISLLRGKYRVHTASIRNSFFAFAVSINFFACAALTVNDFSHKTFLPASRQSMVFW